MSRGANERINSKAMRSDAECIARAGWRWAGADVGEVARWSFGKVMFETRDLARALRPMILLPARGLHNPIMMQTHVAVI
jgi:hypothetical protein